MFFARTTEYWRYGPLSPSKLRASSMSKAITLPRENRTMKYRTAATAMMPAVRRRSSSGSSGLRFVTSASAFSTSVSTRSSAFTPRPLRPDTSTNGRPASSASAG